MTTIDEHIKKIREHLDEIDDAIKEGIEKKPITIGFHCSACSLQFLELYLHTINKLSLGKIIKHDWFKEPKLDQKKEPLVERRLKIDFPKKQEIYNLIYSLENERNTLMYGKSTEEQVKKVLDNFNKIKEIFISLLKNENIEL